LPSNRSRLLPPFRMRPDPFHDLSPSHPYNPCLTSTCPLPFLPATRHFLLWRSPSNLHSPCCGPSPSELQSFSLRSRSRSSRPHRSFPLALPRLCSRSPPRKFASCRQVTSRGYPSARKPVQDCKRSPSLLRPSLQSRARLLPVALPPDQTFPIRDNIARAHSLPSNAHSHFAGHAVIP